MKAKRKDDDLELPVIETKKKTESKSLFASMSRPVLVLWLVAFSMLLFLIPCYLTAGTLRSDAKTLQSNLAELRAALTEVPTPLPEVVQLQATLVQVQGQANQLNAVLPTLKSPRTDWPAAMHVMGNYNPAQMALVTLTRNENRVTLDGCAANQDVVANYARTLQDSALFSSVIIQSIQITDTSSFTMTITPTSTISPTATSTTTPTITNTPDLRDQYEPDDAQPKPIVVGVSQPHNFFPTGDVDTVSFLAKALRYYRVSTTNLAPGVDTVVSVRVGRYTFANDDAQPGQSNSGVTFQNPEADTTAIVTVTNRGEYGPDKIYNLLVEEIAALPTVLPPTVLPSATPAVLPTQTPKIVTATPPGGGIPTIIYITATPQAKNYKFAPFNASISLASLVNPLLPVAQQTTVATVVPAGGVCSAANGLPSRFVIVAELKVAP